MREVNVASVAAGGLTSPEIADQLFLSHRTLDNHLSSIYRKLRVAGRAELWQALTPLVPHHPTASATE